MSATQLRELERDGILERIIYAEIPPRIEYHITKLGKTIFPIIGAMWEWGETTIRDGLRQRGANTNTLVDRMGVPGKVALPIAPKR